MIKIGQVLNFNGREGIICFLATYNDSHYVNVCFDDTGKDEFKIYEVIVMDDGKNYKFRLVKDSDIINELANMWTAEALVYEEDEEE